MNQAYEKGHRAGMNTVSPAANPFPRHTPAFFDWAMGHHAGRETKFLIQDTEFKLYRSADPARYQMLWG